jgi:nucleotide-binding universal stress UspA family protein
MNYNFLVPIDFTEASVNALKSAYFTGIELGNTTVHLIHIAEEKREEKEDLAKLDALVQAHEVEGVSSQTTVRTGELFEEIKAASELLNIDMVYLGTHGLSGLQYVFGSRALKMVTQSRVPFVIVQEETEQKTVSNIAVPIDFAAEDKQQLDVLAIVANTYNAKVSIFAAHPADEYSANAVKRNVAFAKKHLDSRKIENQVHEALGSQDFFREFLHFAQEIQADLISMVNHQESGFINLLGSNFDQNVITNDAKIPVIIINPKDLNTSGEMFGVYS